MNFGIQNSEFGIRNSEFGIVKKYGNEKRAIWAIVNKYYQAPVLLYEFRYSEFRIWNSKFRIRNCEEVRK